MIINKAYNLPMFASGLSYPVFQCQDRRNQK
jgi:hypothetical protein